MTYVGVQFQDDPLNEKLLPCLTACPMSAFKSFGFHFMNETFYSQIYNMDEIFQDSKQFNLSHDSRFCVEEHKNFLFALPQIFLWL